MVPIPDSFSGTVYGCSLAHIKYIIIASMEY
jgi:hypothetical protein